MTGLPAAPPESAPAPPVRKTARASAGKTAGSGVVFHRQYAFLFLLCAERHQILDHGIHFVLIQQTFIGRQDRKSTRLNSSHVAISYAVFCLKKKMKNNKT